MFNISLYRKILFHFTRYSNKIQNYYMIFKEKLKIFPSNEKLMSDSLSYVIIRWLFMC